MNAPLAQMFEYNRWANHRVLDACAALTDEQFDHQVAGTFGSIRRTLVHLVGSQDVFLWRLSSQDAALEQNAAELRGPWQSWEIVRHANDRGSDGLLAAARQLDEDSDIALPPWEGQISLAPKSFVLLHALEHGMEHRTQICMTMANIGDTPPDLDGWAYASAMGIGRPV